MRNSCRHMSLISAVGTWGKLFATRVSFAVIVFSVIFITVYSFADSLFGASVNIGDLYYTMEILKFFLCRGLLVERASVGCIGQLHGASTIRHHHSGSLNRCKSSLYAWYLLTLCMSPQRNFHISRDLALPPICHQRKELFIFLKVWPVPYANS